jgi:predicted RNase H-like HicB family nuclease
VLWEGVATMNSYAVVYERDEEGWWIARVAGVRGVHSNGRTIEEARRRVREALSLAVDDADEAVFEEDVRIPAALKRLVSSQRAARARAATEQANATELQREAAKRLTHELKLSRRDISELLGVSHQMVQRLVASKSKKTNNKPKQSGLQRGTRAR